MIIIFFFIRFVAKTVKIAVAQIKSIDHNDFIDINLVLTSRKQFNDKNKR